MTVRALGRVALIMLVAGLVIFATYTSAPHASPKSASDQAKRSAMDAPPPGGAQAVRRAIDDIWNGRRLPKDRWLVSALGQLQALAYKGADTRGDFYLASFQRGSLIWTVSEDEAGKIKGLTFVAPQGPLPQDWIDNYALSPIGPRIEVLIIELIKFSILIGFGRLVGIRL